MTRPRRSPPPSGAENLARMFPFVPWGTPLRATLGEQSGLLCRSCLALFGLKGTDVHRLFDSDAQWRAHVEAEHPELTFAASPDRYLGTFYDDLETMLTERRVRRRPGGSFMEDSYDYGVWWREEDGVPQRLTWIGPVGRDDPALAGELYLVRQRATDTLGLGRVELLCVLPPRAGEPPVDGLVEEVLVGWEEVCGLPNSVGWLRDRAWEAVRAGWATKR